MSHAGYEFGSLSPHRADRHNAIKEAMTRGEAEDRTKLPDNELYPQLKNLNLLTTLGEGYTYDRSSDSGFTESLETVYDLKARGNVTTFLRGTTKQISVNSIVEDGASYYLISYLIVDHGNELLHKGMLKKRYSELRSMSVPANFWGVGFWSGVMSKGYCSVSCSESRAQKLQDHLWGKSEEDLLEFVGENQVGGKRKGGKERGRIKRTRRTKINRRIKRKKSKKRTKKKSKKRTKKRTKINRRTKRR